jgi:hypothetical protein
MTSLEYQHKHKMEWKEQSARTTLALSIGKKQSYGC